jgi:hypothetical protein
LSESTEKDRDNLIHGFKEPEMVQDKDTTLETSWSLYQQPQELRTDLGPLEHDGSEILEAESLSS